MTKLVSSIGQVIQNIIDYPTFVEALPELKDRLAMHRAWYAYKVEDHWHFGNSKVIGYAGLSPEAYLSEDHDGRQTEATLQKWFTEVGPEDPLHDELWDELSEFLAGYGKNPSKLARINIPLSEVQIDEGGNTNALRDLIVEVSKSLAPEQINVVRKRLKDLL